MTSEEFQPIIKLLEEAADLTLSGAGVFGNHDAVIYFLFGHPVHAIAKSRSGQVYGLDAVQEIGRLVGNGMQAQFRHEEPQVPGQTLEDVDIDQIKEHLIKGSLLKTETPYSAQVYLPPPAIAPHSFPPSTPTQVPPEANTNDDLATKSFSFEEESEEPINDFSPELEKNEKVPVPEIKPAENIFLSPSEPLPFSPIETPSTLPKPITDSPFSQIIASDIEEKGSVPKPPPTESPFLAPTPSVEEHFPVSSPILPPLPVKTNEAPVEPANASPFAFALPDASPTEEAPSATVAPEIVQPSFEKPAVPSDIPPSFLDDFFTLPPLPLGSVVSQKANSSLSAISEVLQTLDAALIFISSAEFEGIILSQNGIPFDAVANKKGEVWIGLNASLQLSQIAQADITISQLPLTICQALATYWQGRVTFLEMPVESINVKKLIRRYCTEGVRAFLSIKTAKDTGVILINKNKVVAMYTENQNQSLDNSDEIENLLIHPGATVEIRTWEEPVLEQPQPTVQEQSEPERNPFADFYQPQSANPPTSTVLESTPFNPPSLSPGTSPAISQKDSLPEHLEPEPKSLPAAPESLIPPSQQNSQELFWNEFLGGVSEIVETRLHKHALPLISLITSSHRSLDGVITVSDLIRHSTLRGITRPTLNELADEIKEFAETHLDK